MTGAAARAARRSALAALVLAGLAAAALWAALADAGPARLDAPALDEALEARSPALTQAAVVLTTLGDTVAMTVLAVLVGAWCWWRGRRSDAVLAVGAAAGAVLAFQLLKSAFDRQRPPVADRLVPETTSSLPSGHATVSIVVVGTLVVLAWGGLAGRDRALALVAGAAWVGGVGATRVYLGVHWVSDVLAGWLAGAAWLAVCVAAWSWWRSRAARPARDAGAAAPD